MFSLKSNNKLKTLTPIEEYNNTFFKRDDKFAPWGDLPLNGGKVRQAVSLINDNLKDIKDKHDSTIISATSVNSPQGIILAKIARENSLKCILGIGGVKNWNNHPLMLEAEKLGAEIKIVSKFGYNSVLYEKIKNNKGFIISFGMNVKNNHNSIITQNAYQVSNIPDVDNLVIPVGSAITLAGILEGICEYSPKIKTIYAIQIAGYDRIRTLHRLVPFLKFKGLNLKFIPYKKFPYSEEVEIKFNANEYLDPIYEAKAFDWLLDSGIKGNTLFWIVGNTYELRRKLNVIWKGRTNRQENGSQMGAMET